MGEDNDTACWFVKTKAGKQGPVSLAQLRDKILSQQLPAESPVWRYGMETWTPALQIGELFPDGVVPAYAHPGNPTPPLAQATWKRTALCGGATLVAIGLVLWHFGFNQQRDPYTYQKVSGDVLYEDGQVIPATTLHLTFIPLTPLVSPHLPPKYGFATVDTASGTFQSVTSRKKGDGIVKGSHKVLVDGERRMPLPEDVVSPEYAKVNTTPLEVDSQAGVLHIRIKRPNAAAKESTAKTPKKRDP